MKKKRTEENEEFVDQNPYEVDKLSKIPTGLILTFIKFWAAMAAIFFILIGGVDLGLNFSVQAADAYAEMARTVVSIVLVSLLLAAILNYAVKHFAHLMHNRRNNAKKWIIINQKGFLAFLEYLVYTFICVIILFLIIAVMGKYKLVPAILQNGGIGIEPFSAGAIYLLIDGTFLLIKNSVIRLFKVIRYNKLIKEN